MSRKKLLKNGYYIVDTEKKEDSITTTIEISSGDISFFRYRSCSEFSLDALIKDEFWVSNPTKFNDPYDTSVTYDPKKLHTKIAEIKGEKLAKMTNQDFNNIHSWVNNFMKKNYYVACLSERIDNPAMWSHYSNYGAGFAVEYNFFQMEDVVKIHLNGWFKDMIEYFEITTEEIPQKSYERWFKMSGSFYPMFYTNKSKDLTNNIINVLEKHGLYDTLNIENKEKFLELFNLNLDDETFTNSMTMKNSLATSKNNYWSYEKEWRLTVPSFTVNQDHESIALVRPKAIYLGEFISEVNKTIICKVAKAKNIDIYQMYSHHSLKGNKLKYKKISDKELQEILSLNRYDFTKYSEEL